MNHAPNDAPNAPDALTDAQARYDALSARYDELTEAELEEMVVLQGEIEAGGIVTQLSADEINQYATASAARPSKRTARPADRTYQFIFKSYVKFYYERGLDSGILRVFLFRQGVDLFFQEHVAERNIEPKQFKKYRTALTWYARHIEYYPGNDNGQRFDVDSPAVQHVLNQSACSFLVDYETSNRDAHEGIATDVLSGEDHSKVMHHVFANNATTAYQDFAMSWTGCYSTFMRQDTLRKVFLCHLRADDAHSPPSATDENKRILSVVLEKGMRKDDSDENAANNPTQNQVIRRGPSSYKKRVVGCYRHKDFRRCFTGMVAMRMVMGFHDESLAALSFIQSDDLNERPGWQRHRLLSWTPDAAGARATEKVYKKMLKDNDVSFNKVTHLRHTGMEQGSGQGNLQADQLATMSKHRGERLFDAYLTELLPAVMMVMSGHQQNDPYFVPRTEIEDFPWSMDEIIRRLFVNYDDWVDELNGPTGDRHKSAKNFVEKLIPFLSRVIIQDAPYWMKHFPNHEYSIFLQNLFPAADFANFCRNAVIEAKRMEENRSVDAVACLNSAAKHSYNQMSIKCRQLERQVAYQQTALEELSDQVFHLREDLRIRDQANSERENQIAADLASIGEFLRTRVFAPPAVRNGMENQPMIADDDNTLMQQPDLAQQAITTEEEAGDPTTQSNEEMSDGVDIPNDNDSDNGSDGRDSAGGACAIAARTDVSPVAARGPVGERVTETTELSLNRQTNHPDRPFVQRRGTPLALFAQQRQQVGRSRGATISTINPPRAQNVDIGPYAAAQRNIPWAAAPAPRLEDVLRSNFDPGIPVSLPKDGVKELYRIWNLKNLGQYVGKTKHWRGPIKTRFKKWYTFITAIQKKAMHPRFRQEINEADIFAKQQHACDDLEKERLHLKMTMTKFYDYLCEKEGRRGVRKRKRPGDGDGEGI